MDGYLRFSGAPFGLWVDKDLISFLDYFHHIGAVLYGSEWNSSEQRRAPYDEDHVSYVADQFDVVMSALNTRDDARRALGEAIPPYSEEDLDHIRSTIARVSAGRRDAALKPIIRNKKVLEEMLRRLRSGEARAVALFEDGTTMSVRSDAWRGTEAWAALTRNSARVNDGMFASRTPDRSVKRAHLCIDPRTSQSEEELTSRIHNNRRAEEDAAFDWMSKIMRDSLDVPAMTKNEFRDEYHRESGVRLSKERWNSIWSRSTKATGATSYSRPGPKGYRKINSSKK